jgi:hypothetical protein
MVGKRTPLPLRVSQLFFALAIVALLLIVAYIGAAVGYATELHQSGVEGTSAVFGPDDRLLVTVQVNLTNPGPFAIDDLSVVVHVDHPNGSAWVNGGSSRQTVAGYSTAPIAIGFAVPLNDLPAQLLVQDATLPEQTWVNATYASLILVAVSNTSNYQWGAPFEGLNLTVGSPTVEPNGSVSAPVTLSFTDDAPTGFAGTLSAALRSSDGSPCTGLSFPVSVTSHGHVEEAETGIFPSDCRLSGGSYSGSWSSPSFNVPLPGGPLS